MKREERERLPEYPTRADTMRQQKVKGIINPERKHRRIERGRGRKSRKIQ
jgi:hypothetical protein